MRSENHVEQLTRTQRARRLDIVTAAVAVLDAEGYPAASVDRIAREAGASKGTVLYHFKSKEALHAAVVRRLFDDGAAYMTERIRAAGTYRERFRVYLDSNLRFIAEHAAHVRAVHRILQNAGGDIEVPDGVEPLRELLAAGQRQGEFGRFDPHVVALTVRAVVDAASFHFTARADLDLDHYIAETVQLFDRALTSREEPS